MTRPKTPDRPHPKTRVVGYRFTRDWERGDGPIGLDCNKILFLAMTDGVITCWDDGRDDSPWFEGKPGPALRALRNQFQAAHEARKGSP
jgi:hypothetical protein